MHYEVNWEIVTFFAFLAINLAVGLYHGRAVKTIEDYALGGRKFSTGALVSTVIATWIGGDYLFITLAEVYKTGLHYTIGCLGMVACLFLNAYVFVPRMQEFLGRISVAEAMGKLYGEKVRIISAISGTIASAGFIAVQFKVFGEILKNYVGLSGDYPIFVAAVIVVIYSAFGGIRSVTFTDVIQFFTFGVLIPVLGFVVWNDYTNVLDLSVEHALSKPIFDYREFIGFSNPNFWSLVLLFVLFSLPDLNPTMFQRVAIGRTTAQVKKAFAISAVILMLILLGMAWIAFLLHGIDPNLEPSSLVQYIIDKYAPYTGLKSFILIGVVAMCMSSADSNINSSSVLLTHDLCQPLNFKFKNELVLSKLIAVMLGLVSIYLALLDYDLLPLVFMTQSFYIPIIDVPLIMAILGFRSTTRAVLIGMSAGLVAVIIWRMFFMDITNVDSILPGMIVNFVFFMGSHYLLKQEGGWIKNDNRIARRRSVTGYFIRMIKNFDILELLKNNTPKSDLTYTGFGVFCTISTICTMYTIPNKFHGKDILDFYETMLAISICFMTYPIWPRTLKRERFVQIAWNLSIFYLLVICSTFFVLLSDFAHLQITVFILNMLVLAILTRWNLALFLIAVGVYIAVKIYASFMGIGHVSIEIEGAQLIMYNLLFIATAIIIFLKPKQQYEDIEFLLKQDLKIREKEHYKNLIKSLQLQVEFVRNLDEGCVKVFDSVNRQVVELNDKIGGVRTNEEMVAISRNLLELTNKLQSGAKYLSEVIYNVQNMTKLKISSVNLTELIVNNIIKGYNFSSPSTHFAFDVKDLKLPDLVDCDQRLITETIRDCIDYIVQHGDMVEHFIKIALQEDMLEYELSFTKEYTKKIKGIKVSIIDLDSKLPDEKIALLNSKPSETLEGIIFNNVSKIITAHYGVFNIQNSEEGVVYSFTIPIKISEIRPKNLDNFNAQFDNIDNVVNYSKEMVNNKVLEIAKALLDIGLDRNLIMKITKISRKKLEKLLI